MAEKAVRGSRDSGDDKIRRRHEDYTLLISFNPMPEIGIRFSTTWRKSCEVSQAHHHGLTFDENPWLDRSSQACITSNRSVSLSTPSQKPCPFSPVSKRVVPPAFLPPHSTDHPEFTPSDTQRPPAQAQPKSPAQQYKMPNVPWQT